MPYEISWWSEPDVLYIKLYGHVTMDDLIQVTQTSRDYLDASDHIIHAVTDTLNIQSLPNNIPALFRQLNASQYRNSGYTIVLSSSKLISFTSNTLFQVIRMNVRIVSTPDEARKILSQLGVTIPT